MFVGFENNKRMVKKTLILRALGVDIQMIQKK